MNFVEKTPSQELCEENFAMNLGVSKNCSRSLNGSLGQSFNAGQVFTPQPLAHWVAEMLLEALDGKKAPVIVDPACGEGDLLHSIKGLNPKAKVFGADIDKNVVETASSKLGEKESLIVADSLVPEKGVRADLGWSKLPFPDRIDGIIANPPWGADLMHSREQVKHAGYTLARGQFDTWELFVELSLKILKRGGVAAFILPDSIFLPEHQKTREFLHNNSSILLIARLGEGFFENVFRGTSVVVVQKSKPKKKHRIEVFRLNKNHRKLVLTFGQTLGYARKQLSHEIEQKRFQEDSYARWDIDAPEDETTTITLISSHEGEWTKWLSTGRGVEMSKYGKAIVCPECGVARPAPRNKPVSSCLACGFSGRIELFTQSTIVEPFSQIKKGWMPLIVGEDVDRYSILPSRSIKLGVKGINYKSLETYSERRLLVRKTGLGLKASITTDNFMTNQVVFHYFGNGRTATPDFYLSYVLGVFSSRVMFAYHLRTNGENEWRSHPYLTQKIIGRLPIPLPVEGQGSWKQAKAIAKEVDKVIHSGQISKSRDLRIEGLVAGLYGFTNADMSWVHNVISSAQELEPMRALQLIDIKQISPLLVS